MLEEIGTARTLIRHLPRMIFYMNFVSPLAAIKASYQEIFKDVCWEKTKHVGREVRWTTTEKPSRSTRTAFRA
jgi:hypothetical protein